MKITNANIWWGPPKKFSASVEERKISWLELFYDLVYVIAISKITHHLAAHPDFSGLLDYIYLFIMIFWGWLNGSMYHDLHGSPGIRTRFMTLWQMMIVAALIVTLFSATDKIIYRSGIALMVMQVYITYLWWSVGIYDKEHRKLNVPYTICYLASFALLFLTLFLKQPYIRIVFYASLILNYLPPFLNSSRLRKKNIEISLSSSMTERLGLFTIIIFGEAVLGVINGTAALNEVNMQIWVNFGLGILIVFALWWLFFSLIADREVRKGFINGIFTEMAYIPSLMSLGMVGAAFSGLFRSFAQPGEQYSFWIKNIFGWSLCIFLIGITIISNFLEYPKEYDRSKKYVQRLLLLVALFISLLTIRGFNLSLFVFLLLIFLLLFTVIVVITRSWFLNEIKKLNATEE